MSTTAAAKKIPWSQPLVPAREGQLAVTHVGQRALELFIHVRPGGERALGVALHDRTSGQLGSAYLPIGPATVFGAQVARGVAAIRGEESTAPDEGGAGGGAP